MKSFAKLTPFRAGSDLAAIYGVLARSKQPLKATMIAKKSKVALDTTVRMLAALRNKYHNAGMRRLGVALVRKKDGLTLAHVRPEKTATRPPRGKKKKAKAKKKSARQHRTKVSPPVAVEHAAAVGTIPEAVQQ